MNVVVRLFPIKEDQDQFFRDEYGDDFDGKVPMEVGQICHLLPFATGAEEGAVVRFLGRCV